MSSGSLRGTTSVGCLIGLLVAIVALGAILVWIIPPILHPFVYIFVAHWPSMIPFCLMSIGIFMVVVAMADDVPDTRSAVFGIGLLLILIGGTPWLVLAIFGGAWQKEAFLQNQTIEVMEAQPNTTGFRYMPYEIAQTAGKNLTADPTVHVGELEPLSVGDEAKWIAAREPAGLGNTFFGSQKGVVIAQGQSEVYEDDSQWFSPGVGTCCITNTLGWKAVKTRFWADYSSEYYVTQLNGETVIVWPYLGYEFDFPTMVPYLKGVLIYHSDETIEDLSPEEAANKYPEGRFFPHELVSFFSDAYQYKKGVINAWLYHLDQPDVPKLSGPDQSDNEKGKASTNQFPFLIPTENGQQWFTAVEPYGSSRSVYKSYYVDATTGKIGVYDFPEPLVGPDRAASFISSEFQELKNAIFIEPRTIVRDGNLYWVLTSTTDEYVSVSFSAVVDAQTEEVYKLDSEEDVRAFIESGTLPGKNKVDTSPANTHSNETQTGGSSTEGQSDEELIQILRDAADKLEEKQQA